MTMPSGQVLECPRVFTSVQTARMHIERHHGYWMGDVKTVKALTIAHAAMHGQGDHWAAKLKVPGDRVVPHIHTDTKLLGVIEL